MFNALPFGLTTAPYIFTRVMSYPISVLRKKGVFVLAYLDDLILWAESQEELKKSVQLTLLTLEKLGFILNYEKSQLTPCQDLVWLGIRWIPSSFQMALTPQYRERLRESANLAVQMKLVSRRQIESLQGLIAFACQILPLGRLHAHRLPKILSTLNGTPRDELIQQPQGLINAVQWWTNPVNLKTRAFIRNPSPNVHLFTDASSVGYGAHTDSGSYIQGQWSKEDMLLHINSKELLALVLAVESDIIPAKGIIALFTDNIAVYYCIKNQGSNRSAVLQKLTERLFQTVEEKELLLVPSHLAGLLNVTADALSRDTVLPTEWSLNQETFQDLLCQIDFVPEVDAMATPWNAQLQQFICPFPHPLASGRDFFLTKLECWKSMYIFPPPKTLLKVLEKMNNYQGRAIVIAPNTPAQPWFPILRQKASRMLRLLHPPQQEVQGIIHRHCIQSCSHFHAWIL